MNQDNQSSLEQGFAIQGVGYTYSRNVSAAVSDIDLQIASNQFVAIVGPSGCGKSTLLKLLAGIERPTSGTLNLGDKPVLDISPKERNFGVVFQNCPLYPEKTVEAVIRFPLESGRRPRSGFAVQDALGALRLTDLRRRNPASLSGGERQRVALARTLVWTPSVMLLDEPLSAVDHDLRPEIVQLILQLQRKAKSLVVYVTHDQIDVFSAADKVVVLADGKVQQYGTPQDVYSQPASELVGRLVGDGPLALVDSRVGKTESGKLKFYSLDGELVAFGDMAHFDHVEDDKTRLARIGFRPEQFNIVTEECGQPFPATVSECLYRGSRFLLKVNCSLGLIYVWHSVEVAPDERVRIAIQPSNSQIFDPANGRSIGSVTFRGRE